jgi:hypothetical protein
VLDKFDISKYKSFSELPLQEFDKAGYSIYVLDKNWNYIFVNEFVKKNLGDRAKGMRGKNMWQFFPELSVDGTFRQLRKNTENNEESNFISTSPLTQQRIHVTGHPINDCFVFTSSVLPRKEEILDELRRQLKEPARNN